MINYLIIQFLFLYLSESGLISSYPFSNDLPDNGTPIKITRNINWIPEIGKLALSKNNRMLIMYAIMVNLESFQPKTTIIPKTI